MKAMGLGTITAHVGIESRKTRTKKALWRIKIHIHHARLILRSVQEYVLFADPFTSQT